MTSTDLASIEFSINWESSYGTHKDRRFIDKIHFWRDIFPGTMGDQINLLKAGGTCSEKFDAGILVPAYSKRNIKTFKREQFVNGNGKAVTPTIGKFYPQGWAWKALNCFPQNVTPFRVIEQDNELIVADTNHPLSRTPVTVKAKLINRWQPAKERGGECKDIASLLTGDGPGMQLPYQWMRNGHYSPYPFVRENDEDDATFYEKPRLVNHLDDTALIEAKSIYSRLLCPGERILDLMSSWNSHLPDAHRDSFITGLGLNDEELRANPQLKQKVVHDLNKSPKLPFDDNSFDSVICTASVEYLTMPIEIFTEIARVTTPGSKFITLFSDRWFPGKEIEPWADLHHFERVGLVMDYFHKSGCFENVHTESIAGHPRPFEDKHFGKTLKSDPIFAVWATVKWT